MTTANFIDFSQAELRNIVQDHNLHLMIKNYSKLTKSELVKLIETMLFIDSNNRIKIMPKILSKYNEYFKDITPGYIIVKRKFKKAPKEQPKQKLPAIPTIPESYSKEIEKHKKRRHRVRTGHRRPRWWAGRHGKSSRSRPHSVGTSRRPRPGAGPDPGTPPGEPARHVRRIRPPSGGPGSDRALAL